ncbi:30S ribosomal protein S18 [bacterium]|uniref:Small ribosomal subunit protein bS18 n=1 Tax=candidate division WOR-3 bacterium TaxID=2052148 RepID=A0A7C0VAT2_UNCW3|nr:MAG: 30S ribosomal protein S18 [bacterium]RKZ20915.1 MAG: 30S ribosomal protein S18 [bacterium]HDI82369.1 30S ribosomal protein S18 [candidate division WOR-3 bacterium]
MREKTCYFCANHIDYIDYKDVNTLKRFITDSGKILPARITHVCAKHQRKLKKAIKRARMVALLPFVATIYR